ncbi:zinc finger MIZ domain-containing protein 1-like isoform X2 [Physella acuta]|uniref:zinc finger MIZ domain-containing protein 1-like isoform X2 n=1 Tax=Physella acuta TaxID=109671 RepID=UPI0027DD32F3|nr:zinc finger MIZ domain-containing protein 1-like isoform X2 [Physella acuta]
MEKHIQQTNDRLQCIKQHLSNPGGFQSAARELLEWCSDQRAFQLQFEDSLMGCLTVVYKVASQPGYDFDLGYRLLAVCSSHKDLFSPKAASQLSEWCEVLGQSLLLRHPKNRPPDGNKGQPPPSASSMHPQMHKAMQPMHPGGDPNAGWGGPNPGQTQLNVVTTIFPVHTTQSGPFTHNTPGFANTTMTGASGHGQPPQGYPSMNKPGYNPQAMAPYNGYPPTPNTPGSNQPQMSGGAPNDYTAPPGALSAAAYVAAAATATATATATASMVAIQEQQNQQQMNINMQMNMNNQYASGMQMPPNQHQYGPQYPPGMPGQRHPGPPMSMGGGPCPGPMKPNMYHRRPAPYHNPYIQKRPPMYQNGAQMEFVSGGPGPHGPYMPHQQYTGKPGYPPAQQPLPSPTYVMPQGMTQMRQGGPSPYPNGQHPYMTQGQYGHPQRPTGPTPNYSQYPGQTPNSFPHSPIPGNPTPPITPGSVPGYPGDMKPSYPPDVKPMVVKSSPDELRLTFPVRDGVVLPPFRLEHNLAVSNHVFQLRDTVYNTLMYRSDLELQLKCFHHEDRQMSTNWPASVTVSVNATPLNIERGDNKSTHKPLYLKEVCQAGRNTIQITVTACCCSHLFVLQLVHRPSIRSVLQGLLRKRLLPAEHCITKIKRNFSNVPPNNAVNGEDGVEQTAIKVPLKCPITCRRITLPARGHDCKHIQCFDLESYLQLNCDKGLWKCPVCNKSALLEGLEIDQYIWGILTNMTNQQFEEVTINQTASWKPVPIKSMVKEEDSGRSSCPSLLYGNPDSCQNSWMKAMSPSSMQLPTMTSWDAGPQASPYNLPPPSTPGDPMSQGLRHPDPSRPPSNNHMTPRPSSQPHPQNGSLSNLSHPSPGNNNTSSTPNNCNNNLSNGISNNSMNSSLPTDCHSLGDLNFDPTAIINGDTSAAQGLDLLADNLSDMELLTAYLGPSDSTGDNGQNSSSTGDDLLALFEN